DRGVSGKTAESPPGSGAVLPFLGGANSSRGDGGLRALSLVRAAAGGVGSGAVAGRCGEDPGLGGTQAENGSAGRGAFASAVAGRSVSADLGAGVGGAGHAPVAGASSQASAGADAHQEPVAGTGVEPGGAEETQ